MSCSRRASCLYKRISQYVSGNNLRLNWQSDSDKEPMHNHLDNQKKDHEERQRILRHRILEDSLVVAEQQSEHII